MKKKTLRSILPALIMILAVLGAASGAPRTGARAPRGSLQLGAELGKLLPRSTRMVMVLDVKRFAEIDVVAKAMQEPKFKTQYDEVVRVGGIDPQKDIVYACVATSTIPEANAELKDAGIVLKLRYDRTRIRALFLLNPGAKEEIYLGVPVYSFPVNGDKPATPGDAVPADFRLATLDESHIVIGNESEVRKIIDVSRKKAEPLAKNPEMAVLLSRVQKSGVAWMAISAPPEFFKKLAASNPLFKTPPEDLKGVTLAVDDRNSTFTADLQTLGGSKEKNATDASTIMGLKDILAPELAASEPVLVEVLDGISATSGDDFLRVSLTVSHETLVLVLQMIEAESKKGEADKPEAKPQPEGGGAEWRALIERSGGLYEKGDYAQAAEVAKQALELAEKNAGPEHPDTARSLNDLGLCYEAQEQYAEAEPLYKRALAVREKAFGPDHLEVADTLTNLGDINDAQDRYPEAEGFYKRALEIREKLLGPNDLDVSRSLVDLAGVYYFQERYAEAEPLCKRALAIREKALGPDHLDLAVVLSNLGYLNYDQERYAEAEPLFKRALAIREKALAPDHLDVAGSLTDLGNLYYDQQGRWAESEPFYRRALAIREKALGPDHLDVARSLNKLANLYFDLDRNEEAEPLYRRVLAIREKAFGPDHINMAVNLNNLANLYDDMERYAEAEPLYKRALEIREKALGPDDLEVAGSLNDLANLYFYHQERNEEAEPLYKRVLAIREKAYGPDHINVAVNLNNLANLYYDMDRNEEAEAFAKRALAIREKALGPDHPDVADSLETLARVYRETEREAEAGELEARAARIRAIKR